MYIPPDRFVCLYLSSLRSQETFFSVLISQSHDIWSKKCAILVMHESSTLLKKKVNTSCGKTCDSSIFCSSTSNIPGVFEEETSGKLGFYPEYSGINSDRHFSRISFLRVLATAVGRLGAVRDCTNKAPSPWSKKNQALFKIINHQQTVSLHAK